MIRPSHSRRPRRRPRRSASGAALLLVIWLIALLTAVVGAFAMAARVEYLQGRTLSDGVVADEAARAGLEYAMTRVVDLDQTRQWLPDGRDYDWQYGDADVKITITDESGKIDLNAADLDLLAGLMQAEGVERTPARKLAAAIMDWRDPDTLTQAEGGGEDGDYASAGLPYGAKDAPFETVAELQLVLGMTPELFAKLAPHLTVYSGQGRPNEQYADAKVLQAMGIDADRTLAERRRPRQPGESAPLVGAGTGTYSIDSRARLRSGRVSVLRAVVRAGNSGLPGSAYTPLRWDVGAIVR
ncbi:MAG: general secretion pathway protein GspK [Lysobacteraceae bacterium]